jgi:hypothetical protein
MSLRILAALALIGCDQRTTISQSPHPPPSAPPPPSVSIAGGYSMTITASASCTSLPDFVKIRTRDDVVISQEASLTNGTLTITRPDSTNVNPALLIKCWRIGERKPGVDRLR